jgi:hypothetical protein
MDFWFVVYCGLMSFSEIENQHPPKESGAKATKYLPAFPILVWNPLFSVALRMLRTLSALAPVFMDFVGYVF